MGIVIFLNAVSIGISVDLHPEWIGWIFVDFLFALIFLIEMIAKLAHGGCRNYFCGESMFWNMFESALVGLALIEVVMAFVYLTSRPEEAAGHGTFAVLRVMRLVRVARIVRVLRLHIFAELMMMINGAIGGIRTLIWSFFLLLLPLYVVALLLRQSLGDHASSGAGAESFSTLAGSLFTSFRCLVASDCTTSEGKPIFVLVGQAYGGGYAALYCFTTVFMTFGLFNVIVAIYVENTVAAAKFNDLRQKQNRLTDQRMFMQKTLQLIEIIWQRHEHNQKKTSIRALDIQQAAQIRITPALFEELRVCKEFQEVLHDLDIADEEQLDLFETLDVDGGGTLDLEELVHGIAKLRGDARRSDVVSVSLMVRALLEGLSDFEASTMQQLSKHSEVLTSLQAVTRGSSRSPRNAPTLAPVEEDGQPAMHLTPSLGSGSSAGGRAERLRASAAA